MKRRVNKYIEARKRQQGGIVKAQSNQFRTQLRFDIPTYNFPSPDLPLSYDDFVRYIHAKQQPLTIDL